jgi:hypothetical protein
MRLLGHLIAADLRRFRSTLAAWAALIIIIAIFKVLQPAIVANAGLADWAGFALMLLTLGYGIFFAALIAAVVQNHTLVGTTAFWFARPISPHALLASKLVLLLGLVVGLPAAVDVAVMLWYRIPVIQVVQVSLQTALVWGAILIVLMCAAALTSNLTRFALLCLGVVVGASLLATVWATAATRRFDMPARFAMADGGGPVGTATRLADWTQVVLGGVLLIGAGLVLLRFQYWSRSVRRSALAGVIALCIAVVVTSLWPWRIFGPRQAPPAWARDGSAAAVTIERDTFELTENGGTDPERWRVGMARAHVSQLPDSVFATVRLRAAEVESPGFPAVMSGSHGHSAPLTQPGEVDGALLNVLRRVLAVRDVTGPAQAGLDRAVLILAQQYQLEPLKNRSLVYRGEFVVELTDVALAGALPIDGGVFSESDYRFEMERRGADADGYGLVLRYRRSRTRTIFDRRSPTEYLFFLRNRATGQAIRGYANSALQTNIFSSVPVFWLKPGFSVEAGWLRFDKPRDRGNPRTPDETWLSNADVAIVRATGAGSLTRHLTMNDLTIDVDRK